jgi:uncharacterized GH25 family protein
MRCKPFGLALLLAILAGGALRAHDLWIEPSAFTPAPGQHVAVRLRVGQGFRGDPVPRDPKLMERFAALGAKGEVPIPGVPNTEPAGFASFADPGLEVLVYDSRREPIELEGAKFEEYLREEGLQNVISLRAKRGQSAAPGREVFSRCAKALVAVGGGGGKDAGGRGYDRVAGLPLELVPEKNPYTLTGGGDLPVRLLYAGKPLADVLVMALQKGRAGEAVSARSDAKGRVALHLDGPGVWLVKAVHMVAAPKEAGADWESFWASVTFEIPAAR